MASLEPGIQGPRPLCTGGHLPGDKILGPLFTLVLTPGPAPRPQCPVTPMGQWACNQQVLQGRMGGLGESPAGQSVFCGGWCSVAPSIHFGGESPFKKVFFRIT